MKDARVLVVDDHVPMVRLLADQLSDAGFTVLTESSGRAAIQRVADEAVDVVLTDLRMPEVDGLDVVDAVRRVAPDVPVIVMTAFGSIDSAVEAVRRGAFDYVAKPFRNDALVLALARAVEQRRLRRENARLHGDRLRAGLDEMVGRSKAMEDLRTLLARIAPFDAPVLVRGESGTGKELVARALHAGSPRSSAPFVAVNCASLPETLLESELFGHVKGAFTGAVGARRGLFVEAHRGTLFLDEIGDMPLEVQAHLLRVLEDGQVRPVGADAAVQVDVRIVAATHQPLEDLVAKGRFRADLFYRLDVVSVRVPSLRERTDDIADLVAHFLARVPGTSVRSIAPAALSALEAHPWRGNVRELENLVRRLAILVPHERIEVADLGTAAPGLGPPAETFKVERETLAPLRQIEDEYVAWVVARCGGNKTRAADLLGIDVSTIHRRARTRGPDAPR